MSDLKNRVALVTGASRGIGKAIALALAQAEAAVAVNYQKRIEEAESVVEAIRLAGGRGTAIAADVSIASAVQSMISDVEHRLGPIDILVNNAGTGLAHRLEDITEEIFDRTIAVNLKSAFLCTQAVLPGMRARRWGRIVNISSIAARGTGALSVAYNASKAGVEGLTRGYAARLAPEGVTVNAVAPGLVDTEMGKPLIEAGVAARIPVGRVGTGEDIAQAVMLLVSDAYITGPNARGQWRWALSLRLLMGSPRRRKVDSWASRRISLRARSATEAGHAFSLGWPHQLSSMTSSVIFVNRTSMSWR